MAARKRKLPGGPVHNLSLYRRAKKDTWANMARCLLHPRLFTAFQVQTFPGPYPQAAFCLESACHGLFSDFFLITCLLQSHIHPQRFVAGINIGNIFTRLER